MLPTKQMNKPFLSLALLAAVSMAVCIPQDADAQADAPTKVKVVLRDKSQLVGTPGVSSLELAAGFGKISVPLAQITLLTFTKDGVTVRLANKDVLTGTLAGTAFEVETTFGKVSFPYAQIESVQPVAAGARNVDNRKGLLLHAQLDSDTEDLSAFNARLEVNNVQVVEGRDGKALLLGAEGTKAFIDLPFSPYTMPEGTIEFWAKLPQPKLKMNYGGQALRLFTVRHKPGDDFPALCLAFDENCVGLKGGLRGLIWGGPLAGTHSPHQVSSVKEIEALNDAPDGWHHYAFIWKWDGLDFPEVQEKTFGFQKDQLPGNVLLLTIDGKPVASAGKTLGAEEGGPFSNQYAHLRNPEITSRLFFFGDGHYHRAFPLALSDLKIWDHARLPVLEGVNF